MGTEIKWVENHMPKTPDHDGLALMATDVIARVRNFHRSFPQYKPTPLYSLQKLADMHNVAGIYIKDESRRYNLNAFKVLGGSYAMASFIAQKTGRKVSELGYIELTSNDVRKDLGHFTFYTATDGNHGRGVAWAANMIGQHSVVFMPKGSSEYRYQNIKKEGADVTITDMNYDDAVRYAYNESQKDPEHSVALQDTAWEGYTDIPTWIMQGYGTVALEALEQLIAAGVDRPTHIIVQAGVGSFAGAMAGFFANYYGSANCPTIILAEPYEADCHYRSARRGDGGVENVGGEMKTIMAGLCCGEVNTVSWDILKNRVSIFTSLPDYVAAKGMRILSSPRTGDPPVISGESGAVGMGLLMEMLYNEEYADLKRAACMNDKSTILLVSTEGDTDPQQYRRIVWDGEFPAPYVRIANDRMFPTRTYSAK